MTLRKTVGALSILLFLFSIPGCGKSAPPEEAQHAEPGAVPGSYEDWCVEHEVPESQCTQCNPALVAAFKATGDWCAEHGLPESQCRACNPDLEIERPAKKGDP